MSVFAQSAWGNTAILSISRHLAESESRDLQDVIMQSLNLDVEGLNGSDTKHLVLQEFWIFSIVLYYKEHNISEIKSFFGKFVYL
jgi:hypothetical protein